MWKRIFAACAALIIFFTFAFTSFAETVNLYPNVDTVTFGFSMSDPSPVYYLNRTDGNAIQLSDISYPFTKHFFRSIGTVSYDTEKYVRGDLLSWSYSVNAYGLTYMLYSGVLFGTGISAYQRIGNRSFSDYVDNHGGHISYFDPYVRVFSAPSGGDWFSLYDNVADPSIIRIRWSGDNYSSDLSPQGFYNAIKDYTPAQIYAQGISYTVTYRVPVEIPLHSGDRICFQVGFSHYATVQPFWSTYNESGYPRSSSVDPTLNISGLSVQADLITNSAYQTELQENISQGISDLNEAMNKPYSNPEVDSAGDDFSDAMEEEDSLLDDLMGVLNGFGTVFHTVSPLEVFSDAFFPEMYLNIVNRYPVLYFVQFSLLFSFFFFIMRR